MLLNYTWNPRNLQQKRFHMSVKNNTEAAEDHIKNDSMIWDGKSNQIIKDYFLVSCYETSALIIEDWVIITLFLHILPAADEEVFPVVMREELFKTN